MHSLRSARRGTICLGEKVPKLGPVCGFQHPSALLGAELVRRTRLRSSAPIISPGFGMPSRDGSIGQPEYAGGLLSAGTVGDGFVDVLDDRDLARQAQVGKANGPIWTLRRRVNGYASGLSPGSRPSSRLDGCLEATTLRNLESGARSGVELSAGPDPRL
jgi:hypothetical protein